MKKNLILVAVLILILVGGFFALNSYIYNEKQSGSLPRDFKEITFTIRGESVTLQDGTAFVQSSLDGDSVTTVKYFGNEARQDIDGDGKEDVVFLITQEIDGSDDYFYLVGALKRGDGYIGSQAVMLGSKISPQTTEKGKDGMVVVNFVDQFSIGKSLWLRLDPETLEFGEVVQNFEGETR